MRKVILALIVSVAFSGTSFATNSEAAETKVSVYDIPSGIDYTVTSLESVYDLKEVVIKSETIVFALTGKADLKQGIEAKVFGFSFRPPEKDKERRNQDIKYKAEPNPCNSKSYRYARDGLSSK